jgi:hypothetical protein
MEDPRLGLPSASSFSLTALCPGREELLRSLPDIPEPVDEDAARGVKLHSAWEKENPEGLDSEDLEIYERGLDLVKLAVAQWVSDFKIEKFIEGTREERFYFHSGNGELSASGQADRHYRSVPDGFLLVLDFKSLYAKNLVPSEMNWQARFLSVSVSREYCAHHSRFSFLKAMWGKLDTVDYAPLDLERAEYGIHSILWESRQPHAQRRASAHCRHCKAASGCPEAAAWQMLPSVQAKAQGDSITPKVATELVENISLLDCVRIFETSTARRNIEDACKARLKALPSGELAELGLMFGKPKILRPITKVDKAFEFLLSLGVPVDKLWAATKMSNGELTTVVQESLGLKSQKEAQTWVREKLSAFITETPTEKPLEKI